MANAEQIASIIESIGPRDSDIDSVRQLSPNEFVVDYGDIDVMLEFDAELDQLVFSAEVGQAPQDRKLAVYTTLLNYSLLRSDTGGVYMALTAGGAAVQLLAISAAEITGAPFFETVLQNFTAKARLMRGYVVTGGGGGDQASTAYPHEFFVVRA